MYIEAEGRVYIVYNRGFFVAQFGNYSDALNFMSTTSGKLVTA
jgi:hypothetical protein